MLKLQKKKKRTNLSQRKIKTHKRTWKRKQNPNHGKRERGEMELGLKPAEHCIHLRE